MPAPVTTFDQRYSDPAAVAVEWEERAIEFSTGAVEQKFANRRENPHVALTAGCNRRNRGLDVVVEPEAVRVTDDAVLSRVAGAFAAKWDGRGQFAGRDGRFGDLDNGGEAMMFSVTPVKLFTHAKGDPFGVTTHTIRRGVQGR